MGQFKWASKALWDVAHFFHFSLTVWNVENVNLGCQGEELGSVQELKNCVDMSIYPGKKKIETGDQRSEIGASVKH